MRLMESHGAMSLASVARQQDLEAVLAQGRGQHSSQRKIIVDHQDPLAVNIGGSLATAAVLWFHLAHRMSHSRPDEFTRSPAAGDQRLSFASERRPGESFTHDC